MLRRYKVVAVYVPDSDNGQYDDLIEILDEYAREGWRLVNTIERRYPDLMSTKVTLFLEREQDPAL